MKTEKTNRRDGQNNVGSAYTALYEIIKILRAPGGCPWDREQTPLSLRATLLEETYEALEAINEYEEGNGSSHAREELGDVMLNASMIGYMFEQQGDFRVTDIFDDVCEKLIRRHPHVFAQSAGKENALSRAETPEQVLNQWEAIKAGIEGRGGTGSVLDGLGKGLDPLSRACKLQKKAAKKGFDWDTPSGARSKIIEEMGELDEAVNAASDAAGCPAEKGKLHIEEELGDLLFALVNWARHIGVEPAVALEHANAKFCRRFKHVERRCRETDVEMKRENLKAMDAFWEEAKKMHSVPD